METHTPFHSGGLGCVDTKAEGETELGYVDNIVPILGCIASTLLLHIVWSLCCQEGSWGPSVHLSSEAAFACLFGSFYVCESHDFKLLKVVLKVSPATSQSTSLSAYVMMVYLTPNKGLYDDRQREVPQAPWSLHIFRVRGHCSTVLPGGMRHPPPLPVFVPNLGTVNQDGAVEVRIGRMGA